MPPTLRRAVITVLTVALLLPTAAPAAPHPGRLTIRTSASSLLAGQRLTVTGIAAPARTVALQRRADGAWRTVGSRRVADDGAYRFTVTPPVGRHRYRTVKPAARRYPRAVTDAVGVVVRRPVQIDAQARPMSLVAGEQATISGRLNVARPGVELSLQRWTSGAWRTVARGQTSAGGGYRFVVRPPQGTPYYRVVGRQTSTLTGAVSSLLRPNVTHPCPAMPRPATSTKAWFTTPRMQGPSPIAAATWGVVCAAAPGATINVALFYLLDADSKDAARTVRGLQWLAAHRQVRVNVVLESRTDQSPTAVAASIARLQRWATVSVCTDGCRSRRDLAIQHNKFVTVSDTVWKAGPDPVVVQSSANWSKAQLRNRRQHAVMVWDDQIVAREYMLRFESMRTCAQDRGCAAWNAAAPLGHTIHRSKRVWYDDLEVPRGYPTTGRTVMFSPWKVGDPLAQRLDAYVCAPGHDTVRVAQMFVTAQRHEIISALARMQQRGCDVRIVVSSKKAPNYRPGIQAMRKAGLEVTCLGRHHEKFVLLDAVGPAATAGPSKVLWAGSQNFGINSLRRNDEALLELSSSAIQPMPDNAQVWQQFARHFRAMREQAHGCFD